jgi:hypothetical protein
MHKETLKINLLDEALLGVKRRAKRLALSCAPQKEALEGPHRAEGEVRGGQRATEGGPHDRAPMRSERLSLSQARGRGGAD